MQIQLKSFPADHQRCGLQKDGKAHAEAAGGHQLLDAEAQPGGGSRGLDLRGRGAPHGLHLRPDGRADG